MSHSPESDHPTSARPDNGDGEAMPPAFVEFLADALPKDGRSHTLALGEAHDHDDHIAWLRTHIGEIKDRHGIQTIGLEMQSWFNLFLWAYKDGTLEKELGNKEIAREYLKSVFISYAGPKSKESAVPRAELAIAALDAGLDVVTYDGRDTLQDNKNSYKANIKELDIALECYARQERLSVDKFLKILRQNPLTFVEYSKDPTFQFAWLIGEAEWLLSSHARQPKTSNYATKLKSIENLISLGHQKVIAGNLTSDGLSAILFSALAGKGNRLTIGGAAHIFGIAYNNSELPERHPDQFHGTFAHQLEAVSNAPQLNWGNAPPGGCRVTRALIATDIMHLDIAIFAAKCLDDPQTKALNDNPPALLNLNTGTVGEMCGYPKVHPREVPLEDIFPTPKQKPTFYQRLVAPNHVAAHINPLLMPDIARAAAKVRSAVHEPEGKWRA